MSGEDIKNFLLIYKEFFVYNEVYDKISYFIDANEYPPLNMNYKHLFFSYATFIDLLYHNLDRNRKRNIHIIKEIEQYDFLSKTIDKNNDFMYNPNTNEHFLSCVFNIELNDKYFPIKLKRNLNKDNEYLIYERQNGKITHRDSLQEKENTFELQHLVFNPLVIEKLKTIAKYGFIHSDETYKIIIPVTLKTHRHQATTTIRGTPIVHQARDNSSRCSLILSFKAPNYITYTYFDVTSSPEIHDFIYFILDTVLYNIFPEFKIKKSNFLKDINNTNLVHKLIHINGEFQYLTTLLNTMFLSHVISTGHIESILNFMYKTLVNYKYVHELIRIYGIQFAFTRKRSFLNTFKYTSGIVADIDDNDIPIVRTNLDEYKDFFLILQTSYKEMLLLNTRTNDIINIKSINDNEYVIVFKPNMKVSKQITKQITNKFKIKWYNTSLLNNVNTEDIIKVLHKIYYSTSGDLQYIQTNTNNIILRVSHDNLHGKIVQDILQVEQTLPIDKYDIFFIFNIKDKRSIKLITYLIIEHKYREHGEDEFYIHFIDKKLNQREINELGFEDYDEEYVKFNNINS